MAWTKQQADDLAARAREVDAPPHYEVTEAIEVRGEPLREPIYWTGRQWAVTAFGIEARNGVYPIPKRRLWDEEGDFGWVQQLAAKPWIDLEDFAEALRLARARYAPVNPRAAQ